MKSPSFEELIRDASAHEPDTAAAELGFETRLAANLRALKSEAETGFLDVFGNWLWRSALGIFPVVAALLVLAFLRHGICIPEGADTLVSYVSGMIPETTLFVR